MSSTADRKFLLLSLARSQAWGYLQFWNQNLHGYTNDLSQVGVFTAKALKKINFNPEKSKIIELKDEPNEIGITLNDIMQAAYFKDTQIRIVLWNESDLNGKRLIEVVEDLFKKGDKNE